ncbi:MAG: hypothetical protein QGI68_14890 [Pseudomonadales bacterium]|nr:hypothetical protein [Pseudomonadales bacterium]MDP7596834.1 hypothetical protein [Pseudomonadales bacterium]HJN52799.1 hypothetical protein [Pseudomonadales bacterium]
MAGTYLTRQAAYLLQEAAGIQDLLYTHSLRASMTDITRTPSLRPAYCTIDQI